MSACGSDTISNGSLLGASNSDNRIPHMLMYDRLSTGGNFILCDVNIMGSPIRYASQGFVDLFGYNAYMCSGRKCGDLVGMPAIVRCKKPGLTGFAESQGLTPEEARTKLKFLMDYAGAQCKAAVLDSKTSGYALLANRKKNGEIFVCEMVVFILTNPDYGWRYFVGLQRDVTHIVSLKQLLASSHTGAYEQLLKDPDLLSNARLASLNLQEESTMSYLHEKAEEVTRLYMMAMVAKSAHSKLTSGTTVSTDITSAESSDEETDHTLSTSLEGLKLQPDNEALLGA